MPAGAECFFTSESLQNTVEPVTITHRLTLKGVPDAETVPSWREPSLPEDSIRVNLGDHEVVLTVDEWGGLDDELDAWLRAWVIEQVNFSRATLAGGRSRPEARWTRVLRGQAPWWSWFLPTRPETGSEQENSLSSPTPTQ